MSNTGTLATTATEIGRYDSGHGIRCFCKQCGSPVCFESKDFPGIMGVPLGVRDSGEIPQPEMHLWVNSKPEWCAINDDLPQFAEGPDGQ